MKYLKRIKKYLRRERCRINSKRNWKSESFRDKMTLGFAKVHKRKSRAIKALWADPEFKEEMARKISEGVTRQWKEKGSAIRKWANSEEGKRVNSEIGHRHVHLATAGAVRSQSPNKPERKLNDILQKYFPGEFKLNVKGGLTIGRRIPDFVNCNGHKVLVEHFGDYWHGEKRTGRTKEEEEARCRANFSKYGFKTVIIWENEVKSPITVRDKVREMF
jgi:G:T-mismatch repair DNA endonuclease (very short patch repair protein)